MKENSNGLILGAILAALGVFVMREFIKNRLLDEDSLDSQKIPKPKAPQVKVIPRVYVKDGRKIIDVKKVIEVKTNPLPYHLEQGWQKTGRVYRGYYRCRRGAFRGEIEERFNGDYKFYIFDPPKGVFSGSHSACFTRAGVDRYHIHFGTNSGDLDAGIMAVERILYQSLKN